ncbi:MAG: phosphoribosylformylglycinamidine synthase I [Candidatus Zixiibacteriota bacterium]
MKKTKVIVLRAAGSNCDYETVHAFRKVGGEVDLIHINQIIRKEKSLSSYHILAIPGGFTYGDDISAGKILANELKYKVQDQLQNFYQQGKLIIGICNGFQVLVKAGLLPELNLETVDQKVTLTFNDSGKFEDRWVYLKRVNDSPCVFTQGIENLVYFPVAHSEGKFVPGGDGVLEELKRNHQIVFQYVDAEGKIAGYPWNPNGSIANIAGICDPSGRVFGLMPHPERHFDPTNHPRWTREGLKNEGDGVQIFRNAIKYIEENTVTP